MKTHPDPDSFRASGFCRATILAAALGSLLAAPTAMFAVDWTPVVTTTLTWNSNLSNAYYANDEVKGWVLDGQLATAGRQPITGDDTLLVGLGLTAHAAWDYAQLDQISLQPSVGVEHRFGVGTEAPVVGGQIAALGLGARDSHRSGYGGSALFWWRTQLAPEARLTVQQEFSRFDGRWAVYDATAAETSAILVYDAGPRWQINGALRWRAGDIVSYATVIPVAFYNMARATAVVKTFDDTRLAYSLDAHTFSGAFNIAYRLNSSDTIVGGYELSSASRGAFDYTNLAWSIAISRQL